ncbi:hypothetical protein Golomagni_07074, partial [Golovinomyces magnicellulatus]
HLQTAAVRVGFNLGLFKLFSKTNEPQTVDQLATTTGADPIFLRRYITYLAAIGVVEETGVGEFAASNITRNLADPSAVAGISHCFETCGPQFQALPAFMEKTGHKNPSDELDTVFQAAWHTKSHGFEWFSSHPKNLGFFNDYMALRRSSDISWLSVYPVANETKDWDPTRAVYVNIGGGIGHQCAQFKQQYPDIPGRVILQDLPHSIAKALPTPGVENMEHNFFEPQPVQGAKFYFTRGVLHNHPDERVKKLLSNTKQAMTQDSIMLLDEMVLPEKGVNAYASAMDLTMMGAFAAMERTEAQWRTIIEDVGLKLVMTYVYNRASYESVMDVRLP